MSEHNLNEVVQKKKFDIKKNFPWMVSGALAIALVATVVIGNLNVESKQVVATVNGQEITQGELYKNLKQQYGSDSLSQMINQVLIEQQAKKKNIKVSEKEMNAEIDKIKAQFDSEQAFTDSLKQYNMKLSDLKKQITTQLQLEKLLANKIAITDKEYQTEFEAMKKEKVDAGQIRASHILVATQKEADAVLAELKDGADFAAKAAEVSTDGSASNGGDLDYFAYADMVKAFSDAAFKLKENEISGVVKTEFGYHIIKVTDIPSTWTLEEKKAEIAESLKSTKLNEAASTYIQELTDKAKIKNTLTAK